MTKQPNILFILTDQQRKDTLTTYGDLISETPVLDQLAEDSTVFENAYASCPICAPARATIQTGLYPMHHGMLTNSYNYGNMIQELPNSAELLSNRLKEQGYQLGYTGKWHLGSGVDNIKADDYIQTYMGEMHFPEITFDYSATPEEIGYQGDYFPGHGYGGHHYPEFKRYLKERGLVHQVEGLITGNYGGHQAGEVISGIESTIEHFLVERTKELLSGFSKEAPWYFQLNFWGPHEPYFAPTEFLEGYRQRDMPKWENYQGDSDNKPRIHDLKRANDPAWSALEPYIQHYFANTSHIDYQIGRLLAYLKERDLYDETIIIFSSDHGESLGIHNGLCDKAIFMYEETCSIPLLIKGVNQQKRGRVKELVSSCDLYSTILEFAGWERERVQRDGLSLVPLVTHETCSWREAVVTECSGIGSVMFSQRMIRKGEMKYVFNCGDIDELYDLETDPYEKINLIDREEYRVALLDMRGELEAWMLAHNDNLIFDYRYLRMRE